MKYETAREAFACLGIDLDHPDPSGWSFCKCPLAGWRHQNGVDKTPSCRVMTGKKTRVHCFGCGWGGQVSDLVLELKANKVTGLDYGRALALADEDEDVGGISMSLESEEDEHKIHYWPEPMLASYPIAWNTEEGRAYLESRGVTAEVAAKMDIRYDSSRRRVCFPIRDYDGGFTGMHGRLIEPGDVKYLMYHYKKTTNPDVWLGEHTLSQLGDSPLIIAESVFDLASALRVYDFGVSARSASLSARQLDRLQSFGAFEIVTLFDPDKAGDRARNKVTNKFKGGIVKHAMLPPGTDGGDADDDLLRQVITAAYPKMKALLK